MSTWPIGECDKRHVNRRILADASHVAMSSLQSVHRENTNISRFERGVVGGMSPCTELWTAQPLLLEFPVVRASGINK